MTRNLQSLIEEWRKNTTPCGELRAVQILSDPVIDGEYIITLKMIVKVIHHSHSEEIMVTQKVATIAQSGMKSIEDDQIIFEVVSTQLEQDFVVIFNETKSKLQKAHTSEK